ncbi:hypothetical protein FOZ63_023849, partial [Perkinsus olseni]
LYSGYAGYQLAFFLFVAELSTPWLYLFQTGIAPEGSLFALASQVMFAALFLVGRMIVAPYLATWLCDSPTTPIEVKVVKTFVKGEDEKPEDPGLSGSQESFSAAPKVYIKSRKAAEAERTIMILGGYSSSSSLSSSDSDSDEDLRPTEDTAIKETHVASPVPSRGLPSSSALEEAVSVDDNRGRIDGCERHSDTTIDDIRPAVNDGSTEPKADDETPASALSAGRYAGAVRGSNGSAAAESLSVSLGSPSSEPSTPEEVERVRDAPDAHTYIEQARMNARGRCSAEARRNIANLKKQAKAGRYVHTFLMANRKFHNPKWTDEMFEKFGITEEIQRSTTLPPERYDPEHVALSERDYWDWRPVLMPPRR